MRLLEGEILDGGLGAHRVGGLDLVLVVLLHHGCIDESPNLRARFLAVLFEKQLGIGLDACDALLFRAATTF